MAASRHTKATVYWETLEGLQLLAEIQGVSMPQLIDKLYINYIMNHADEPQEAQETV